MVNADGSVVTITELQPQGRLPITPTGSGRSALQADFEAQGETKGNLDLITVDGDNAKVETIKDGFDGPVSLVQVGDTIYVLDVPLRYLLGPEAKAKKAPPPFTAFAVKAPQQ